MRWYHYFYIITSLLLIIYLIQLNIFWLNLSLYSYLQHQWCDLTWTRMMNRFEGKILSEMSWRVNSKIKLKTNSFILFWGIWFNSLCEKSCILFVTFFAIQNLSSAFFWMDFPLFLSDIYLNLDTDAVL